jgi:hypothetical protein
MTQLDGRFGQLGFQDETSTSGEDLISKEANAWL